MDTWCHILKIKVKFFLQSINDLIESVNINVNLVKVIFVNWKKNNFLFQEMCLQKLLSFQQKIGNAEKQIFSLISNKIIVGSTVTFPQGESITIAHYIFGFEFRFFPAFCFFFFLFLILESEISI